MKSVPFFQWVFKTIFGEYDFPVQPISKNMTWLDFFLNMLPRYQLNLIAPFKNEVTNKYIGRNNNM